VIRIRATDNPDDIDTIAALDRECFAPSDAYPVDLESNDPECWLATDEDGRHAGYAVAVVIDGIAYMRRAGVLPEFRGGGLQRRLINVRVRWAMAARCHRIETYTMARHPTSTRPVYNHASMRSLYRAGFKTWEPPWRYVDEPGEPAENARVLYWHRRLA
jgi:GNAT superfamily N-acetyltransferase